jgi:hypothetical protein
MEIIKKKILDYQEKILQRNNPYKPFEVVFYLSSPMSLTYPWLFFDGIISHLVLRNALGDDYYNLPSKMPLETVFPEYYKIVPLEQSYGVFRASVSLLDGDTKKIEVLYKRFEDRYIPKTKKSRIPVGSGFYKSYAMKIVYFPVKIVRFYAKGDVDLVNELLFELDGLGSETRVGWGAIRRFEINVIDNDFSWIKDGLAMRPLPVRMLSFYKDSAMIASKPPYWDIRNVEECAVPFTEVRLG